MSDTDKDEYGRPPDYFRYPDGSFDASGVHFDRWGRPGMLTNQAADRIGRLGVELPEHFGYFMFDIHDQAQWIPSTEELRYMAANLPNAIVHRMFGITVEQQEYEDSIKREDSEESGQ